MANAITTQTIMNGPKNLIVKVHVTGDGSGDESNTNLVDVSSFSADEVTITGIHAALNGFTMELLWDATANISILCVPDYEYNLNGSVARFGGIPNNAGSGKTGDILFSTTGLGNGDKGSVILEMVKK